MFFNFFVERFSANVEIKLFRKKQKNKWPATFIWPCKGEQLNLNAAFILLIQLTLLNNLCFKAHIIKRTA